MRNRWMTSIIYVAASIALAVTLFTSYQLRAVADCQADVNTQFLNTQRARAAINDGDRLSVRALLDGLLAAGELPDPKDRAVATKAARNSYYDKQAGFDVLRDQFPLPKKVSC